MILWCWWSDFEIGRMLVNVFFVSEKERQEELPSSSVGMWLILEKWEVMN